MSLLERTRQIVPTPVRDAARPWQRLAVAAGFGAVGALALALILVVPAMAAWVTDAQSPDSWFDALTLGPVLWVLAHRGSTGVPDADVAVTFPVLGLTALAVVLARSAAGAALVQTDEAASEPEDDEGRWWHLPAAYVGGYALCGFLLAAVAWLGPARPGPVYVLPGAALVAALGFLLAAWRVRRDDAEGEESEATVVLDRLTSRVPVVLQRAARPALLGAAALLAVGALLVLAAVATSWSRISEISGELGAGTTGGLVLVLGQALALPNLAAWGGIWLSGAAVQVGPVTVGHAAVSPGVLPMVPVFGALPEAGAGPAWAPFAPVVPVVIGAVVGWLALGELTALASLRMKIQTAGVAGALAGVLVLLVGFVGSMGVSGGTMTYVGPSPLAVPLLPTELALGAIASATALHYWRTLR